MVSGGVVVSTSLSDVVGGKVVSDGMVVSSSFSDAPKYTPNPILKPTTKITRPKMTTFDRAMIKVEKIKTHTHAQCKQSSSKIKDVNVNV